MEAIGPWANFCRHLTGINGILMIIQFLAGAFIAITFIQSSLDKIFNYKSNLDWLKGQFSKTFLAGTVPLLLPLLTLTELLTGLCCSLGSIMILFEKKNDLLVIGFLFSGIAMLMLLFGQRVSKEYAGAASLTGYFLVTLAGLLAAAASLVK